MRRSGRLSKLREQETALNIFLSDDEVTDLVHKEISHRHDMFDKIWANFSENHLNDAEQSRLQVKKDRFDFILQESLRETTTILCAIHISETKNCELLNEFRFIEDTIKKINLWKYSNSPHNIMSSRNDFELCIRVGNQLLLHKKREKILELLDKVSEFGMDYLKCFRKLIQISQNEFKMFAPIKLANDIRNYEIWKEKGHFEEKYLNQIAKAMSAIELATSIKIDKQVQISEQMSTIRILEREFSEKEAIIKLKNEIEMTKYYNNNTHVTGNLTDRLNGVTTEYEKILADDMKNSKKLSEIKFRKQANMYNWIQKYDADVGTRQTKMDELTAELEEITELHDKYKQMLSDQESAYREVVELKRQEAIARLLERTAQRAAKKIQLWFKKEMKRITKKRKKAAKKAAKARMGR